MSRAAAALLALLLAGCASSGPELPVRGGGHLQALALPPVNAAPYAPAPLQGHVVLVAFVATWCVPCLAQLPGLGKLQRELGAEGLRTVAVGMDLEGEEVLAPFAEYYAFPFPLVVADERLRSGDTPFGRVGALPTFFLLDRRGELLAAWEGMAQQEKLEQTVRKVVEAR
jgi:thiol-disulfide isomerase/thioredoxin